MSPDDTLVFSVTSDWPICEKFLLLHTSPRKPINSNRWIYVHLGSFFNLGFDRIDSHLYFIQTLLQVTVPFSPLFGGISLLETDEIQQ